MGWCANQHALITLLHLFFGATARSALELQAINPVPCSNPTSGESGVCMFNWSCRHVANGIHIAPCMDRYLIGSCCKLPKGVNITTRLSQALSSIPVRWLFQQNEEAKTEDETSTFFRNDEVLFSSSDDSQMKEVSNLIKNILKFPASIPSSQNEEKYVSHNINPMIYFSPYKTETHESTLSHSNDPLSGPHKLQNSAKLVLSHDHRKPIVTDKSYEIRNPIDIIESSDQRKPLVTEKSHNMRNPVGVVESHHQRKPVKSEELHNLREPVLSNLFHDIRQPIALESSHDMRLPVSASNKKVTETASDDYLHHASVNYEYSNHKKPTFFDQPVNASNNHLFNLSSVPLLTKNNSEEENSSVYSAISFATNSSLSTTDSILLESVSATIPELKPAPILSPEVEYIWSPSYEIFSDSPNRTVPKEKKPTTTIPVHNNIACGVSKSYPMARIVGGFESSYLKWPWMISLRRLEGTVYKHKCGAALLNRLWAISVAHCVDRKKPGEIVLRLGEYNLHHTNEFHPHIEMRVYLIIPHPDFDSVTYENDLALLRFYQPVPYQENIAPVCLPQYTDDFQGKIAIVTGWGRLKEEGELPGHLHEVHMPILSNRECEKLYAEAGYYESIPDIFICAGLSSGGLDACEGDSGGPMVIKGEKGQWSLIGLISWGMGCAAPKQPGVYTRITKYIDWIRNIIII